jgi:hypothetical protein
LPLAQNQQSPVFSPLMNAPVDDKYSAVPAEEFWTKGVTYIGAIKPGMQSNLWLDGWTSFVKN